MDKLRINTKHDYNRKDSRCVERVSNISRKLPVMQYRPSLTADCLGRCVPRCTGDKVQLRASRLLAAVAEARHATCNVQRAHKNAYSGMQNGFKETLPRSSRYMKQLYDSANPAIVNSLVTPCRFQVWPFGKERSRSPFSKRIKSVSPFPRATC